MIARLPERARLLLGWGVMVPAVVLLLVRVGQTVPFNPALAAVASLTVLAFGLSMLEPAAIPLLAMPAMLAVVRVGGEGLNLSLSDVALFAAFWPALFLSKRPFSAPMRSILWLSAAYQASTLVTVVANPFLANTVEWFHAWLLVSGALVVGWAVGRSGYGSFGLTALLLVGVVIAGATIAQGAFQYAGGNFGPVYLEWPYSMHKNFVGNVLTFVAVIAYVRPTWLRWRRGPALAVFWLAVAGILFAQSQQAMVALAAVILVVSLRRDSDVKRSRIILLIAVPAIIAVAVSVRDELASGYIHGSVVERMTWFADTWTIWQRSPWFGEGLRYWIAGRVEFNIQPPNAEMEMLASAGLIGTAGFLLLFLGALVVLWRVDPRFGTLAFAIVLARFVQGQFDLFWIAVQVSVPFVVAGICLGAQALDTEESKVARELDAATQPGRVGAAATAA